MPTRPSQIRADGFPMALQTAILERFMNEEQIKSLMEEYREHTSNNGIGRTKFATQRDLDIVMDYKKNGMTVGELSAKYGIGRGAVSTSLRIGALALAKFND